MRVRQPALIVGLALTAIGATPTPSPRAEWASRPAAVAAPAATTDGARQGVARELLPEQQIQQVLSRLTFGARPGDVERVRATGVDRWIALQLAPERIEDGAADRLVASYATLSQPTPELVQAFREAQQARRRQQAAMRAAGDTAGELDARRAMLAVDPDTREQLRRVQRLGGDVQSAKLARAVASERQLQEVMVDFWENHFSVFAGKGQTRVYLPSYDRDVIRPRALGTFRDLLGAVATSPAMLFYLDNWQSAADSLHPTLASPNQARRRPGASGSAGPPRRRGLNENYARELMELHTLGVDGGYTQQDVVDVARALTGWTLDPRDGSFVFRPAMHDAGEKRVLGHRLAAGRGIEDGEAVLDIVARHPATARFITTKLARRFVSDSVPPALVDRCAGIFRATDGDIRETVRCVVTSPEFFSRAAYRAKVKTPFEVVASALRALNAAPDTTPRTAQIVARLGQPIFGRQTPDGWPDRADAWMNTGAILNRINFGLAVAGGRVPGASLATWPYAARLRNVSRAEQVDGVVATLLGGEASVDTRTVLMSGENPLLDQRPTVDSTADSLAEPLLDDDPMIAARARRVPARERPVQLTGLAQVLGLALGSPEFQRR
jgi:uncharacterized protein (DUF1800 family)